MSWIADISEEFKDTEDGLVTQRKPNFSGKQFLQLAKDPCETEASEKIELEHFFARSVVINLGSIESEHMLSYVCS